MRKVKIADGMLKDANEDRCVTCAPSRASECIMGCEPNCAWFNVQVDFLPLMGKHGEELIPDPKSDVQWAEYAYCQDTRIGELVESQAAADAAKDGD